MPSYFKSRKLSLSRQIKIRAQEILLKIPLREFETEFENILGF
jgi:hypothetical protein